MRLRTERGRSSVLKRGQLITVDYYLSDDEDMITWIEQNTDKGVRVKVVDYNKETYQLWVEDCPYAIDATICVKE